MWEAPAPWGPFRMFHMENDWGGVEADYTPTFPTKWMSDDGLRIWMVHSGWWEDYNFATLEVTLQLRAQRESASGPGPRPRANRET